LKDTSCCRRLGHSRRHGGGGGGGLRFCLYDYDMLGSHDALGECVLPAEQLSSGTFDGSLDVLFAEKAGGAARVCGSLRVAVQPA